MSTATQPAAPGGPRAAGRPLAGSGVQGALAQRSYNVASLWESSAQLSEEQLMLIDTVHAYCSARHTPAKVLDDARAVPTGAEHGKDSYSGTLEEAVLHNVNQFTRWHADMEAACALEQEEKYKRYADLLGSHLQTCEAILSKVDSTLGCFDSLLAQHKDVSQRGKALHNSCERLVREKESLQEFADAIKVKLKFFDEFENVSAQFQQAQLSLDNEQYLALLKKLDDCLAYVASNPHYADAGAYTQKFRQLQARALGSVRNRVAQVFKHAVAQVQAAIQEAAPKGSAGLVTSQANGHTLAAAPGANGAGSGPNGGTTGTGAWAEGAEVSLLYVRFRAAAEPQLKGLLREMYSRAQGRVEYQRLLAECQTQYCAARQQLVVPFLQQRLTQELAGLQLLALTRTGCEHLLRVCQLEWQLFGQFFPNSAAEAPTVGTSSKGPVLPPAAAQQAMASLTEPLCNLLYDLLRPRIITLHDLDALCEVVDTLKHEVLGDHLSRRGPAGEAMRPMLSQALTDVQGRVIYRCQTFIKEQVAGYQPTSQDTDYPAKLAQVPDTSLQQQQQQEQDHTQDSQDGAQSPQADSLALLYPPLRAAVFMLSKLYRAVEPSTFGGLAQEAVAACTLSIQQASRMVARKASALDAQLFMIKHLLFLREQIAPFDVEFAVTDIDLDFTHMREHMRRIMSGDSSVFALSSSNPVVKMLGTGGPRVLTYQVDSKKELEKQLKGVCEAYIMAVTKVAVDPMLSFLTKVTAVRVAAQANPTMARPLREQAFAQVVKVVELVGRVNEAMAGPLPAALHKLCMYLPSAATQVILLKPVESNIAEAHGQVAALLANEYTEEEVAQVPLKTPEQLAADLDSAMQEASARARQSHDQQRS